VPGVLVAPEQFSVVAFDGARIRALVEQLVAEIGIPSGIEVRVEVDERAPLGRVRASTDLPVVTLSVEGGALEDLRRPRQFSEARAAESLGRVLYRVRDRLDPAFGEAPPDEELSLRQATAWDAYGLGRLERRGRRVGKARRRYHFRCRHGFTDVADQVFERLWSAEGLTFADLDAACEETAAAFG
jgi:hypothetical protein